MFRIHLYRSPSGAVPVEEFLSEMPRKERAKAMAALNYLAVQGPALRRPHAAHVMGKLWELRVSLGRNEYRILYFFMIGGVIVLAHAFQKKTDAIPAKEIEVAEARRRDYEGRIRKGEVKP